MKSINKAWAQCSTTISTQAALVCKLWTIFGVRPWSGTGWYINVLAGHVSHLPAYIHMDRCNQACSQGDIILHCILHAWPDAHLMKPWPLLPGAQWYATYVLHVTWYRALAIGGAWVIGQVAKKRKHSASIQVRHVLLGELMCTVQTHYHCGTKRCAQYRRKLLQSVRYVTNDNIQNENHAIDGNNAIELYRTHTDGLVAPRYKWSSTIGTWRALYDT